MNISLKQILQLMGSGTVLNILDKDIKIVFAHMFLDKNKKSEIKAFQELLDNKLFSGEGQIFSFEVDYTVFFRMLSRYSGDKTALRDICINRDRMPEWLETYDERLAAEESVFEKRSKQMLRTNPKYILKNYMLQEAIEKAERGDGSGVETLLKLACNPYDEHPESERYSRPTPHEYKNLKLSCSS